MTNFSRALIQSWPRTISQRSSLRTQGPYVDGPVPQEFLKV